jgi:hypothetical protein
MPTITEMPFEATSEAAIYKAALEKIIQSAVEWDANLLGGVHVQRRRWRLCGQIAEQALRRAQGSGIYSNPMPNPISTT